MIFTSKSCRTATVIINFICDFLIFINNTKYLSGIDRGAGGKGAFWDII